MYLHSVTINVYNGGDKKEPGVPFVHSFRFMFGKKPCGALCRIIGQQVSEKPVSPTSAKLSPESLFGVNTPNFNKVEICFKSA